MLAQEKQNLLNKGKQVTGNTHNPQTDYIRYT